MAYKTTGTIATVRWKRKDSVSPGEPKADTLTFTLDPVAPYVFEEKVGDKVTKSILLDKGTDIKKQTAEEAEFTADGNDPSMNFAALLLLKLNRTKIEITTNDTAERVVQTLIIK